MNFKHDFLKRWFSFSFFVWLIPHHVVLTSVWECIVFVLISRMSFLKQEGSKSRSSISSISSSTSTLGSGSVSGSTVASSADLASFFECPVCFEYVLPPILQCPSGHLVWFCVFSCHIHILDHQLKISNKFLFLFLLTYWLNINFKHLCRSVPIVDQNSPVAQPAEDP